MTSRTSSEEVLCTRVVDGLFVLNQERKFNMERALCVRTRKTRTGTHAQARAWAHVGGPY